MQVASAGQLISQHMAVAFSFRIYKMLVNLKKVFLSSALALTLGAFAYADQPDQLNMI